MNNNILKKYGIVKNSSKAEEIFLKICPDFMQLVMIPSQYVATLWDRYKKEGVSNNNIN